MTHRTNKQKVLVLMSGGVDSSTATALLKNAGHEVAGVYLKLWQKSKVKSQKSISDECWAQEMRDPAQNFATQNFQSGKAALGDPCWVTEMRDAARVAARLGIPFQVWDVTEDYKKRVLENFYAEYAAGRTPNPDVLCNSEIKFGVALDRAKREGYEYVATGHYARKSKLQIPNSKPRSKSYILRTAADLNKDQSYFLWRLTQEQLAHVQFPIGEYTKPQVRKLAQKFSLHNWNKKDSQGVCFLGKIELKEFLHPVLKEEAGPILDVHGKLLGFHDGLAHFTVGQRHGTRLGGGGPYFVVEKDLERNALIVANEKDEPNYRAIRCQVSPHQSKLSAGQAGVSWIGELPANGAYLLARTRYRAPLTTIQYYHTREYGSIGRVIFSDPQRAVAPGQSIVFYEGERVVGGGIIDQAILKTPIKLCPAMKYAHVS